MRFINSKSNTSFTDPETNRSVRCSYYVTEEFYFSLFDLIENTMGAFSENIALQLFKQILSGLMYIH